MGHFDANRIDPDIESLVDNLLEGLTLRERVGQMVQIHVHEDNEAESLQRIRDGLVGSVLTCYGAGKLNRLQLVAVEESRARVPLIFGNDVIHGYRTIFPIPLAISCTWDPALAQEAARIAAEEASADGTHWTFAPMVDIARDPRWGRIAEGAGEDPFLGAAMARAQVRGFQSDTLKSGRRLVACPKHFAAYGAAEAGKDYNTVDISERTLRDVYLPPFKAAFDAGAGTTMTAFNEIAGVPCAANTHLLQTILRQAWGFEGLIVSDWDAVGELIPHGCAADLRQAAARAARAGIDMDMASGAFAQHLEDLVAEGEVPQAVIDDAARRILRQKVLLGLFEQPYADEANSKNAFLRPDYREKALEIAQKSIVLLKNENDLLPLDKSLGRLALIGPLADDNHEVLGTWHRIGRDEDAETVLDGLREVMPDTEIVCLRGCEITDGAPKDVSSIMATVQESDAVVMVVGEAESMSGEAHSRAHLGLPGPQEQLLKVVHEASTQAQKPFVVVLMSGRPLVIPWLVTHVDAIVQAWHGGIRAGRAIADILVGDVVPSGKLTTTWPRAVGQIPIYYGHKNTGRPHHGPGVRQFLEVFRSRFIDEASTPQYPFGFGLSYTTFEYDGLEVETPQVGLEDEVIVAATVRNTGDRAGDEIVQLYVRDRIGEVTRPVKELKGFQRVSLAPGEEERVRFAVPVRELGFHGLDMTYRVEPGDFDVWIGPDSSKGLQDSFSVQ